MLCIAVLSMREGQINFLTHHLNCYTLPVLEMANVIIHGGTFNSAQGDFHINNKESGMYNFNSVQKSLLIYDPIRTS